MTSSHSEGRRTSHNAPDPVMLDIYDRVGIAVMDEVRSLALKVGNGAPFSLCLCLCLFLFHIHIHILPLSLSHSHSHYSAFRLDPPTQHARHAVALQNRNLGNSSEMETEMRDMVRRDRMHPSVVVWSFCNEAGCETQFQQAGGPRFQRATYELDGSRPTLANMFTYNDLLSKTIDLQGFSHKNREVFDAAHTAMPTKPLWASECCSCNTMRGEPVSGGGTQRAFNADCQQSQTNATDGVDWAIGTTVWTLFDYYGEPSNGGWPVEYPTLQPRICSRTLMDYAAPLRRGGDAILQCPLDAVAVCFC